MTYLLDTNTCIHYINHRHLQIFQRLMDVSPDDVFICDVVKFELYYGAYSGSRTTENLENLRIFFDEFISLPFDGEAAAICGRLRAQLKALGTPIGSYDLQIAALAKLSEGIALTHNLTLRAISF